ncbi:hypothetical protein LINPERPRIM_LOCUS14865 [Linum perenne]
MVNTRSEVGERPGSNKSSIKRTSSTSKPTKSVILMSLGFGFSTSLKPTLKA